jgi:hypothetical protein
MTHATVDPHQSAAPLLATPACASNETVAIGATTDGDGAISEATRFIKFFLDSDAFDEVTREKSMLVSMVAIPIEQVYHFTRQQVPAFVGGWQMYAFQLMLDATMRCIPDGTGGPIVGRLYSQCEAIMASGIKPLKKARYSVMHGNSMHGNSMCGVQMLDRLAEHDHAKSTLQIGVLTGIPSIAAFFLDKSILDDAGQAVTNSIDDDACDDDDDDSISVLLNCRCVFKKRRRTRRFVPCSRKLRQQASRHRQQMTSVHLAQPFLPS